MTISISNPVVLTIGTGASAWLPTSTFQWVDVPNSTFSTAAASIRPSFRPTLPSGYSGSGDLEQIFNSWNSTALRHQGSHIIGHGGGHGGWMGNDIYSLQLNTDNPQWVRKWGPTPNASMRDYSGVLADGNPTASHLWWQLHYDQSADTLIRLLSNPAYVIQPTTVECFRWYWSDQTGLYTTTQGTTSGQWARTQDYPYTRTNASLVDPNSEALINANALQMCQNPTTGDIYAFPDATSVNKWTSSTSTWSRGASSGSIFGATAGLYTNAQYVKHGTVCIDPTTNYAWHFGANTAQNTASPGTVVRLNLTDNTTQRLTLNGNATAIALVTETTTDGGPNNGIAAGSSDRDPTTGTIYLYKNGGIYSFVPSTLTVQPVTMAGTAFTYADQAKAMFNRFRYVPELNGFFALASATLPVKFFRVR
jgi:hypothetical protein